MADRDLSKLTRQERVVQVFKALGHPARIEILDLLREAGELGVGDIAEAFEMSLNGVSKHVKILEGAGLLERRKEGTTHYISVCWPGLEPISEWLDSRRHFWGRRLDGLAAQLNEDDL